jgi:hypothetical protein
VPVRAQLGGVISGDIAVIGVTRGDEDNHCITKKGTRTAGVFGAGPVQFETA